MNWKKYKQMPKDGALLMLGWPETPVSQIGMWYDIPAALLGFVKEGIYKAGHAACVTIDYTNGQLNYFDFGRYHAPRKWGRVRSAFTDPELSLPMKAKLNKQNEILNLPEILEYLGTHSYFHGEGKLYAGILHKLNLQKMHDWAYKLQDKGFVPYGPFDVRGTNCSRFVQQMGLKGKPTLQNWIRLRFPYSITPTTVTNVKFLPEYYCWDKGEIQVFSKTNTNNQDANYKELTSEKQSMVSKISA